jgi:hypothetical protein
LRGKIGGQLGIHIHNLSCGMGFEQVR